MPSDNEIRKEKRKKEREKITQFQRKDKNRKKLNNFISCQTCGIVYIYFLYHFLDFIDKILHNYFCERCGSKLNLRYIHLQSLFNSPILSPHNANVTQSFEELVAKCNRFNQFFNYRISLQITPAGIPRKDPFTGVLYDLDCISSSQKQFKIEQGNNVGPLHEAPVLYNTSCDKNYKVDFYMNGTIWHDKTNIYAVRLGGEKLKFFNLFYENNGNLSFHVAEPNSNGCNKKSTFEKAVAQVEKELIIEDSSKKALYAVVVEVLNELDNRLLVFAFGPVKIDSRPMWETKKH